MSNGVSESIHTIGNGSSTITLEEAEYTEVQRRHNARLGRAFFVTFTYPGGLTESQVERILEYCKGKRVVAMYRPEHFLLVGEGDGNTEHVHVHAIMWYSSDRRSDSITRALRNYIYDNSDISSLPNTSNLVRTRTAVDIPGVFRYLLKRDPPNVLECKLPAEYEFESVLKQVRDYVPPQAPNGYAAGYEDDPESGKTKSIPPTRVVDFLLAKSKLLGIDPLGVNGLGGLVRECFRRGWRFDLRQLRQYRMALELVLSEDPTQVVDEVQSRSMYG